MRGHNSMSRSRTAALVVAPLLAAAVTVVAPAAAGPEATLPTVRVVELNVDCARQQAAVLVKRVSGDTPATVRLVKFGTGLIVDSATLPAVGTVELRDPTPIIRGTGSTYRVWVDAGGHSRNPVQYIAENYVCDAPNG